MSDRRYAITSPLLWYIGLDRMINVIVYTAVVGLPLQERVVKVWNSLPTSTNFDTLRVFKGFLILHFYFIVIH